MLQPCGRPCVAVEPMDSCNREVLIGSSAASSRQRNTALDYVCNALVSGRRASLIFATSAEFRSWPRLRPDVTYKQKEIRRRGFLVTNDINLFTRLRLTVVRGIVVAKSKVLLHVRSKTAHVFYSPGRRSIRENVEITADVEELSRSFEQCPRREKLFGDAGRSSVRKVRRRGYNHKAAQRMKHAFSRGRSVMRGVQEPAPLPMDCIPLHSSRPVPALKPRNQALASLARVQRSSGPRPSGPKR